MSAKQLLFAAAFAASISAVGSVFAALTYIGDGVIGRRLTNNLDLANASDALIWTRQRSGSTAWNYLVSKSGAINKYVSSNSSSAVATNNGGVKALNNDGYNIGNSAGYNSDGAEYVSWAFVKSEKFFDIVRYVGDGSGDRVIAHALGANIGFVAIKADKASTTWAARAAYTTGGLTLNSASAQTATHDRILSIGSGGFTVSSILNEAGVTYIAFLWADDKSVESRVRCGEYTNVDGGDVYVGFAPEWLLLKVIDGVSDWRIVDAVRGDEIALSANNVNAESSEAGVILGGDGFAAGSFGVGKKIIFVAIRS